MRTRISKAEARSKAGGNQSRRHSATALPSGPFMLALRVAGEITAGVAVGGFIGWLVDRWLDTLPLFMIIMLLVGAMAGMLNVWRVATGKGLKIGYGDSYAKPETKSGKRG